MAVVESRYSWGSGDYSAAPLASLQLGCQGGLSQHACINATGKVCICQDSDHAMGMKPFCSLQHQLIDTLVFSHYVHVSLHRPDTEHACQSENTWMNARQQHASTFAPALTATTDSANTALPTTNFWTFCVLACFVCSQRCTHQLLGPLSGACTVQARLAASQKHAVCKQQNVTMLLSAQS